MSTKTKTKQHTLTDWSVHQWIGVDNYMFVGTIPHHLWELLLGGWLSRVILHHCWDLGHWVQKMGFIHLAKRQERQCQARWSRCRPCSVTRNHWARWRRGWSQGPTVGPCYCPGTVSSPALAGSAGVTININFTTLVSVSIVVSVGASACCLEKSAWSW